MYEAAIKRASTGVYFAVPYMAKLIIEFMEKNYQKENRNLRKSRDLLVERILHRYPARRVDSDDDLFDALEEYDSYRNERYERLADDQSKLCKLFMSNPKMGAFISDVPRTRVAWQRFVRRTTSTCHAWHDSANWKTKCGRT